MASNMAYRLAPRARPPGRASPRGLPWCVRVLFIGDVFGTPGLRVVRSYLEAHRADSTWWWRTARTPRAASASTRKHAEQLWRWGVDVVTLGQPLLDQGDVVEVLETSTRIVRPANYPVGTPGSGLHDRRSAASGERLTVGQVMGRVFMDPLDDPFAAADAIVEATPAGPTPRLRRARRGDQREEGARYHLQGRVRAR